VKACRLLRAGETEESVDTSDGDSIGAWRNVSMYCCGARLQ
jgi:hypothetical protein